MYGELGSIKSIIDLSPEVALDEAEAFLASQGYGVLRRTSTTLTAERRASAQPAGQAVPNLTIVVVPQLQGGVRVKIRGNDFEGVQAKQAEWTEWANSLPKAKAENEQDSPAEERAGEMTKQKWRRAKKARRAGEAEFGKRVERRTERRETMTLGAEQQGLLRDTSARITEPPKGVKPAKLRFSCSDCESVLQANADNLWMIRLLQNYEPIALVTHKNMEWWWFKGDIYKVEFEPGRPSAELAKDLAVGGYYSDKWSLDGSDEVGYSPHEIAEGVFELQRVQETDLERIERQDKADDIRRQTSDIWSTDYTLQKQDTSLDYSLELDPEARFVTKKGWLSETILFESPAYQIREETGLKQERLDWHRTFQKYHPVMVSARQMPGRLFRSQITIQWWWFRSKFYIARRDASHRSEAWEKFTEAINRNSYVSQAEGRIPNYAIRPMENTGAFTPEEIAYLAFQLHGEQESVEARFHRTQAAKTMLAESGVAPWNTETQSNARSRYSDYLNDRNKGYAGTFKQWDREQATGFQHTLRQYEPTGAEELRSLGRKHIPKAVKIHVWQRDEGRCVECGSKERLEYDHIIPLSRGGSNTERNLQLLCEPCNRSKAGKIG